MLKIDKKRAKIRKKYPKNEKIKEEIKMTGVIITSIICGTLILICLINKIGKK